MIRYYNLNVLFIYAWLCETDSIIQTDSMRVWDGKKKGQFLTLIDGCKQVIYKYLLIISIIKLYECNGEENPAPRICSGLSRRACDVLISQEVDIYENKLLFCAALGLIPAAECKDHCVSTGKRNA